MIKQGTLTEHAPIILDATCSYARIWPRYASIRIDIRPEVKPDTVMDAGDLKFPDHYFDTIYCDPPHLIRSSQTHESLRLLRLRSGRTSPGFFERYGLWVHKADWLNFVERTNKEFYRCLKPTGTLHYKLTESNSRNNATVHLKHLLKGMTNFETVSDKQTPSRSNLKNKSMVHWLTMKPKYVEIGRKRLAWTSRT